ncbi:MAG: hypothetical protein JRJ44_02040, partial [Deltaproteobacteria bacterium]|nr:hypothetical protein [Deltaproteobacteria bacterium]
MKDKISTDFIELLDEFIEFLERFDWSADYAYEILEARMDFLKLEIQKTEDNYPPDILKEMQNFFREKTDKYFCQSRLINRARKWPEGYHGDHITLEMIYNNKPAGKGLGKCFDKYYLSRTLAVAVRSRLRFLNKILNHRIIEDIAGNWLVLGSGSCREFLNLPTPAKELTVNCVDFSLDALNHSKELVGNNKGISFNFINRNIIRYIYSKNGMEKSGKLTTIYSVGLFDYIDSDKLIKLIDSLYSSLDKNGMLIFSLKDKNRYETFD